ncbi:hypothetical protein OM427_23565 [Halomonas sp. 18H]|uniref:hypothetical protein n=1 Tax=Halomonas almeriensis TaxID=308163 RepID=UPI002230F8A9|nr:MULTISPECIES: hypothetical protein [Halomonas]MCW4152498.1 hypothetical protein [Halomonas sp. 18H]MDN3553926.1 hypothetical protein [Halomonas almeriensis]
MTSEPHRLQYLEAMGLTAWVARYRMPNALETPSCEWESPASETASAPGERLHALLDDAGDARAQPSQPRQDSVRPPAGPRKARALLGDLVPGQAAEQAVEDPATSPSLAESAEAAASPGHATPAQALRFTWQISCLDGRWLVVLPTEHGPSDTEYRLLGNLLRAAAVVPGQAPRFESFRWPQLEGLPVESPLDEAQDGLRAFLNGRRQRGWQPERLLLFGEAFADPGVLGQLLNLGDGWSELLSLPVWHGPDLQTLSASAEAKRRLLPELADWPGLWSTSDAGR